MVELMRKNKHFIAALSVFVLVLLTSIFCMNVFAEETEGDEPLTDSGNAVVSGCDLKKEELHMETVDMAGFKMLVPKGDVLTVESPAEVFAKSDFDRGTLINEKVFFYFNNNNENYCQIYAGLEQLGPLDSYYGDYSKLTKAQQDELIAQNVSQGDSTAKGSFEKINGRTYLMISKTDVDTSTGNKYVVYGLYTVIGSYKYIIQTVVINPDKNDLQVVNEMLNSIKLGGVREPLSPLDIALIVCVAVLLVAVAIALFTLYRMNRFVKTGTELKTVFGFDLPAVAPAEDDDSDDNDDTDDGDYDNFEDDASETTNETQVLDSDEKIVDDESDSE